MHAASKLNINEWYFNIGICEVCYNITFIIHITNNQLVIYLMIQLCSVLALDPNKSSTLIPTQAVLRLSKRLNMYHKL